MKLKSSYLVRCFAIFFCYLSEAEHKVIPYEDCDIDPLVTLEECRATDGKDVDILAANVLPSNTSCTLINQNQRFQVECRQGILTVLLPDDENMEDKIDINNHMKVVTELAKPREVRSFGEHTKAGAEEGFKYGGPLGAVVGASVGFIVDVFCLIFCSSNQPPPNKPPALQKAPALLTSSPIYAPERKTTAKVTWEGPVITDPEDGKLNVVSSPSSFKSGMEFPEGSYVVYFVGTDSGGLSITTDIFFEVKVLRCGFPRWPEHGYINCESNEVVFGTECDIECKAGYKLEDNDASSLACGKNTTWIPPNAPECKPIDCNDAPEIPDGQLQCLNNKAEYDNICQAACNDGFVVKGWNVITCDIDGEWGPSPECKDIQPPTFSYCPNNKQVYIDSPNNTAMVTWDEPKGSDNSDGKVAIREIHGYEPGQRFDAGSYTVIYTIEDDESNKGDSCFFNLNVLSLSCSPPDLGENLVYDCPDSYLLGASCSLACKSGYPKAGEDTIRCMRDTISNPPALEWKWNEDGLKPFCKITNCSEDALDKPLNGALACGEWPKGQYCQLQCNDKYDIPSYSDGFYVCGLSDGSWRPSSYVPDCNQKLDVTNSRLPNEFYYYTGECSNSTDTIDEIKENFVQALNTSKFFEECVGDYQCQAKFVDVTCGPISSRRKRSLPFHAQRRSLPRIAYIINFDLILPYVEEEGKLPEEIFQEHEQIFQAISDQIQAEADSGHFDIHVGDLYVDEKSYKPDFATWDCPPGMTPKIETASCAGCPKGHYANTYGKCIECPLGTYQSSPNMITCELCPPGTNTTETRSENITQCLEYCKAGEFSPNKLAPCIKCPSHAFQPNARSENCIRCENNQRTPGEGATAKSQCQGFDVQLSALRARIQNVETHDEITLIMWLYISNLETDAAAEITKSVPNLGISLRFIPTVKVIHSGVTIETGQTLPTLIWVSLALSISKLSEDIKLYINGEISYENSMFNLTSNHVLEEHDFIDFFGEMKITALSILPRKALSSEIEDWSSNCSSTINGSIISSDDLAESENVTVIVPSVCDAVNECKSSPCGTHECINKLGDYKCICLGGFTGKQCQILPDFCENNNCGSGATCVNGAQNYTCKCAYGYSGALCEIKAVDGQWSSWSSWTGCSKTCGGGVATRERRCDSPPPDSEGKNCMGDRNEMKACNEDKCPECLKLRRTFGLDISCNETSEKQRCVISCEDGLFFSTPPLPYYECGVATGYKWNHQNETNTKAILPACSAIQPPLSLGVEFKSVYESIPCTTNNKELVKGSLETKMSSLDCKLDNICETAVGVPVCENLTRRKRITDNVMTVTIGLGADVKNTRGDFNVSELLQNTSAPTQQLIAFLNQTLKLEKSAQKILNDSEDFFNVTIDGVSYTVDSETSSLTYRPTTTCPSGTVRTDVFCAESPVGSYSDGVMVIMCPTGQYQDETGQSSCKQCPQGKTTDGIGSINVSECSVPIENEESYNASSDGIQAYVKIAVGVSASLLMLTLAVAVVVLTCKYVKKKSIKAGANSINLNTFDVFNMQSNPLYGKTDTPEN